MKIGCKYLKIRFIYSDEENADNIINRYLVESSLDKTECSVFRTMFLGFRIMLNIQNAYFRVCEYTDGKYTLNVRKDLHNYITINFTVNPYYNGIRINH